MKTLIGWRPNEKQAAAMLRGISTRTCRVCNVEKPFIGMVKADNCKHGTMRLCSDCDAAIKRKSYYSNIEEKRRQARVLRADNPQKFNERDAKRRAAKLNAIPDYPDEAARLADEAATLALGTEAKRLGSVTGLAYHVDHIIPLAKGGPHTASNLCILEASDNISKNATMPTTRQASMLRDGWPWWIAKRF